VKALIKIYLTLAITALPAPLFAQPDTAPKPPNAMNCPAGADMGAMQKDMGGMMTDMNAMMSGMNDPKIKERMQKMHEQMAAMLANMQKMGGMMGGGAVRGGQAPANAAPAAPATPPAAPEDHDAHHPGQ
jgi:hypothetical protein